MTLLYIALAVLAIILAIARLKAHPVLALIIISVVLGFCFGLPAKEIVATISAGFGGILAGIGLIVVFGSIIGVALERSGAAVVVAEKVLSFFGPKRPALAVSIIGALVSIPVFCDSGFILLNGLNKGLARKTGVPLGILSLALAGGLYTTHTLVPPTPGPIAAAGQLGADAFLGTIMLLGGLVTIPVLLVTYFAAQRLGRHLIATPEDLDYQTRPARRQVGRGSNAEMEAQDLNAFGPSTFRSFAPLLLPIFLIAAGTIASFLNGNDYISQILRFTGQPLVALLLGLIPALGLARSSSAKWNDWVTDAIKLSGPILIITGAGGAFGAILKASSLQSDIQNWVGEESLSLTVLLLLAFFIAALLKTAQGSSTNALVITAGMMAPLVAGAGLAEAYDLALVVLAIGGGAMTVSHANDSYFWVVTKFSGISVKDAYRSYTPLTGLMGLTTLVVVLLLHFLG
ncbi:gluconate transporter [Lewinellaceae bacterium SD302]|nr:gluconate transporter [Lewinellaceae bacterium SD302]